MNIETQLKIRNNPYIYQYLRVDSSWYKALNRNPENIKIIEEEMKKYYKLNFSDKLNNLNGKLNMIQTLMNILK